MTLIPGTTLGRYQIMSQLGQGGMAIVHKASQGRTGSVRILGIRYYNLP
jgi:hypothetical protein